MKPAKLLSELIQKFKKIPYGFKAIGAVLLAAIIVGIVLISRSCSAEKTQENASKAQGETGIEDTVTESEAFTEESEISQEELEIQKKEDEITMEIASYGNIGIINCNTHLFMREQPDTSSARIGKLYAGAACSLIAPTEADGWYDTGEWQLITSGGIMGYVSTEYLYTGQEAKEKARENIAERAIILADVLNMREEPSAESKIIDRVYKGERYLIRGKEGDWFRIEHDDKVGYVSADCVEVRECLNEARRLLKSRDKETALNLYTSLGITCFDSGLRNVRKGPGTEYTILGMLTPDCAVQVEEQSGEWLKIKSGPVEGYVKAEFIMTGSDARDKAMDMIQLMAISDKEGLNVRSGPGTEYDVLTSIARNERYPVIGSTTNSDGSETWIQIDLGDTDEDGNTMSAYVRDDLVTVRYAINEAFSYSEDEIMAANSDSRRAAIVEYALKWVGGRYVWGGTSLSKGCDCSGFTQSVLANFGIYIPRVSRDQAQAGRKITSAEMRPGDLIFYANKSGTINHVTMYIGGGRIVGAQSARSGIKTAAWNYRTPVKIVNVMGD